MKTAMYTLAGLMCLLTSCVDDDKDLSVPPTGNTTDLVIPDGFDWSTTRTVTLATNAPHAVSASIYLDEACSEQIADLAIPEGDNNTSQKPSHEVNRTVGKPTACFRIEEYQKVAGLLPLYINPLKINMVHLCLKTCGLNWETMISTTS